MKPSHPSPRSRKDQSALERRRLKAAKLFRQKVKHAEIARRLGVSRAAVRQWYVLWQTGGQEALKTPAPLGRKPKLAGKDLRTVERLLVAGPEAAGYATGLWTLERIATMIRAETGVRYETGSVWYVLGRLGWTSQRPETRARERNEAAIARWQRTTWPALQKKGSG